MKDVTLFVTLTLRGPVLTHSTSPGAGNVSSPFARSARGGYHIPGSLVKGRLREAWAELESAAGPFLQSRCGLTLEQLLGEGSGNRRNGGASTEPKRGRLHFEDFEDLTKGAAAPGRESLLYRIRIDEARGSVGKGAYQVIEAPYASGEEASFVGRIHFRAGGAVDARAVEECVLIGLRWVTNLGANCNVGFGRLLDARVTDRHVDNDATTSADAATGAVRLDLEVNPQSPFCVSRRQVADNLFESDASIPGAVLKGSVAHTWRALLGDDPDGEIGAGYDPSRPELCEHFHQIRFTHAFPAEGGKQERPVTPPLSLVKAGNGGGGELYDAALSRGPFLVGRRDASGRTRWSSPAFSVDWKDDSDVRRLFGWADPKRDLRVRTAIDASRRKAKDEQLFAYETVVPDGAAWHSSVDLGAITDEATRLKVEGQLRGLLALGLRGLGKTKARADVTVRPEGSAPPLRPSTDEPLTDPQTGERFWVITLQTPAILCDPQEVNRGGLFEAYRQAWDDLSSSRLRLKHFYARQSLSGGYYLYRRFMNPGRYYPYVLTDAGSVFVLAAEGGREAEARQSVGGWLAHGLPLPGWVKQTYARDGRPGDDWRNCPYLREGGYGEVAVNLSVHRERAPQEIKPL